MKAVLNIETEVKRLMFSRYHCFKYDGNRNDIRMIKLLSGYLTQNKTRLGFYGAGKLCRYILANAPELNKFVNFIIDDDTGVQGININGINVIPREGAFDKIDTVFLCAVHWETIEKMRNRLPVGVKVITIDTLLNINWQAVPSYAWVAKIQSIYPVEIPEIKFQKGLDLILIDLPARTLAQLPVGFGYVHDALKKTNLKFQTIDTDIIIYHRFHSNRILNGMSRIVAPSGFQLPDDPWLPTNYLIWERSDVIEYFRNDINEIVNGIVAARPKILALSLQQANITFAKEVIMGVRQQFPEVIVLAGGMSCLQPDAAKIIFPEADYIIVGEADLMVGPLTEMIFKGEQPHDLDGVWSRYDTKNRLFSPGPIPMELDELGHPRYEWADVNLYRNWNGYQLVPIVGSRGCSWARCNFCGERFLWRARSPERVVDDIEYFYKQGSKDFVFNESDLHGDPKLIERLCDEIMRRKLSINITAQLRCNNKTDRAYYKKLKAAGFGCLRFGVDAASANTLCLQQKGYNKDIIYKSLKDAAEAGIYIEVNLVIGVPGETEADVDETIEFIGKLKPYIGRVAFLNPLMLFRGSNYWDHPEKFGICFNTPKEELFNKYPVAIPDYEWHSVEPYIDVDVRLARFARIVEALNEYGIPMGDFANFTVKQVGSKGENLANMYNANNIQEVQAENVDKTFSPREAVPVLQREDAGAEYLVFKFNDEFLGIEPGNFPKDVTGFKPDVSLSYSQPPRLISSYKGYNIVYYGDVFLSVPRSLGPLDLTKKEHRQRQGIIISGNEAEARKKIESANKLISW